MAWTKTSQRGYMVATETLTLPTGASTDVSSSVIDWVKPGQDFLIVGNTAATALTATCDVDVDICMTSTGTFVLLKDTAISNLATAGTPQSVLYDVSVSGEAPFYKIRLDPDGNEAGEKVTIAVITTV